MAKFKFKLQSILSVKEKIEDKKKTELGLANTYKQQLDRQMASILEKEDQLLLNAKQAATKKIDIQSIKHFNNYGKYLKKQQELLHTQIEEAERKVEEKRQELVEAMKERKILEKLKEISLEEYLEEMKKKDQQIVDELVSYKYTQSGKGEV